MEKIQVVIDTNVIISALRSQYGASYKLLTLLERANFEVNLSAPLLLEYEDVSRRQTEELALSEKTIDDILDYFCTVSRQWKIYYLWRPFLKDSKDDMVLELAVASNCEAIITYNKRDFLGIEQFGLRLMNPQEFLLELGEIR
ncbi:MAG: putative toxin-antitoxin system toxin component, PIN family [Anaerolineaceae bacterium 4572_5.2]|nr:MAG: putative toxin-antitoxin system toxin component, PIN family [Anaerolineaceae bacterium 4572_5.2]